MTAGGSPDQKQLDRLTADLRVFDANGIERAAWGWDRHERRGLDAYHAAERAALAQIEQHDLGPRWEEFRRALFGLTESPGALVSWKANCCTGSARAIPHTPRIAIATPTGLASLERVGATT